MQQDAQLFKRPRAVALGFAIAYLLIGALYIVASDYYLRHTTDGSAEDLRTLQLSKGLFFIVLTGFALFWLLYRFLHRVRRLVDDLARTDTALRSALQRIPGLTAIFNDQRRFEFINSYALELAGLPLEEVIGKRSDEVYDPVQVQGYNKYLEHAFNTGEPAGGEISLVVNHKVYYFVATFVPMLSRENHVERVIALAYDISDRKNSTIRMEQQRRELRQIIDLIPNFVFAKDAAGHYIMANEAFSRFHGLSPDQVIGQSVDTILPDPSSAGEIKSQDVEVLKQGKPVFRASQSMRDADGVQRMFQVTKIPFRTTTDNQVAVLGVAIDITERLKHEKEMQKVQERVTALVDHSLDALFVYGRDGKVSLVNERACQLLGKTRDELIRRNFLEALVGSDVTELLRARPPIYQNGASFQMVLHSTSGLEVPVEIRVGRLPGEDSDSYLAEIRDISERLRAERERTTLSRLGVDLSAARSPAEVAQALFDAIRSTLQLDAFFFAIRISGRSRFRNIMTVDTVHGELVYYPDFDFEVPPDTPLPDFYRGKPKLVLRKEHEIPQVGYNRFGNIDQVSKSMVFVPVALGDKVIATLSAQSYQLNAYNHDDLDTVQRMADMAAPALESARANRKGSVFARLGQQLGAARTADEVAQVIAAMADELTGWDCCIIALYSNTEDSLTYIYLADIIAGQRRRIYEPYPYKKPRLFAEKVLREGPFMVLRESSPEPGEFVPLTQSTRPSLSMLWVPIPGEDGPTGLISLHSYAYNAFDEEDLESIKALAEHCGAALNRTASQALLRYREERYRLAIESTGAAAYQLDYAQHAYIFMGAEIEKITGYKPSEMCHEVWKKITLQLHMDPACEISYDEKGTKIFNEWRAELLIRRKDGQERWISDQAVQVHNSAGSPVGTLGIIRDITEQKRVELALRASEERYALSARGANDGLWDWDLISNTVHFSERWAQMLGISPGIISDSPEEWFDRVHPDDSKALNEVIEKHLAGETRHLESEVRMRHEDGSYRWMLIRGIAVRDEYSRSTRIAGSQTDITDRILTQERLLHNALHDPLTGLPNRTLLMEHLSRCLDHVRRRSGFRFALVFMDLDRFKTINDSLGHLMGDHVLVTVAQRIKNSIRPVDIVARFAGDEFAMVLEQIDDEGEFSEIVSRVQAVIAEPISMDDQEIITTMSAGIALGSPDYQFPEDLLRDADNALYKSKSIGAGRYCVFDSSMHEQAVKALRLEGDLRRAIERNQLRLHFQPIVSVESCQVERFEALLRWQHPEWGLLMPDKFIAVAEETGLIFSLDEWVIEESCRCVKEWQEHLEDTDGQDAQLRINVNLSPRHFLRHVNLAERFSQIVRDNGLSPNVFGLELTENALLSFRNETTTALRELKDAGFTLYLDDFGKGYSSLSYLHNFPFDMVKIDRHFVGRMQEEGPEREIVEAILILAGKLNLKVVAEGVETERQLEIVRELGCDAVQGFFISRPQEPEVAIESVKTCRTW